MGEFDADRFGRLGEPQGVEGGQGGMFTDRRGLRPLTTLLAVAILLAILVGGSAFVLSRSFFVGVHEERVAIFTGVNQELLGLDLYRVREETDLPVAAFAPFRRERLEEGITAPNLTDARQRVAGLREEFQRLEPADGATAAPRAEPEAGDEAAP